MIEKLVVVHFDFVIAIDFDNCIGRFCCFGFLEKNYNYDLRSYFYLMVFA